MGLLRYPEHETGSFWLDLYNLWPWLIGLIFLTRRTVTYEKHALFYWGFDSAASYFWEGTRNTLPACPRKYCTSCSRDMPELSSEAARPAAKELARLVPNAPPESGPKSKIS